MVLSKAKLSPTIKIYKFGEELPINDIIKGKINTPTGIRSRDLTHDRTKLYHQTMIMGTLKINVMRQNKCFSLRINFHNVLSLK